MPVDQSIAIRLQHLIDEFYSLSEEDRRNFGPVEFTRLNVKGKIDRIEKVERGDTVVDHWKRTNLIERIMSPTYGNKANVLLLANAIYRRIKEIKNDHSR